MRVFICFIVASVISRIAKANTCKDEEAVFCPYKGENIAVHCHGSSQAWPPIWIGETKWGEVAKFTEDCQVVEDRRQLLAPFEEGTNKPVLWCCEETKIPGELPPKEGDGPEGAPVLSANSGPTIVKNLVLLLRFKNHKDLNSPLKPKSAYEQFFNGEFKDQDYNPTGSVKHYFDRQSFGKVIVESVIVGWIDVSVTEKEASSGCSSLCTSNKLWDAIIEGLDYADSVIDFETLDANQDGQLDGLTIIHSGFAAEAGGTDVYGTVRDDRIWSHKWGLDRLWRSSTARVVTANRYNVNPGNFGMSHSVGITRLGVVVHELGHFFGLPDLYDTDFSSSGIHVYGVMSSSWGVDGSQYYPQSLSPWCKYKLGWIKPKMVVPGTNTIYPGNDVHDDEIYMFKRNFPESETIWIEYRKRHEWDQKLPGGILIWHSDDNMRNNRNEWYPALGDPVNHFVNRVIQADGKFKLEKETWPIRYDPGVFWTSTNVLSDFGNTNLLPYSESMKGSECLTTGSTLRSFVPLQNRDAYTMEFEMSHRQRCDGAPIEAPTKMPTTKPPTNKPTAKPTPQADATKSPTKKPTTKSPTRQPTNQPTNKQTTTKAPTRKPTSQPTKKPTTAAPTKEPTKFPTSEEDYPTKYPSIYPTSYPTTPYPTSYPTSAYPTSFPTASAR